MFRLAGCVRPTKPYWRYKIALLPTMLGLPLVTRIIWHGAYASNNYGNRTEDVTCAKLIRAQWKNKSAASTYKVSNITAALTLTLTHSLNQLHMSQLHTLKLILTWPNPENKSQQNQRTTIKVDKLQKRTTPLITVSVNVIMADSTYNSVLKNLLLAI